MQPAPEPDLGSGSSNDLTVPPTIDVNCDLGEGFGNWSFGNDAEIMRHVTSVNIACGFHAGDPMIMGASVDLAIENGLTIGAHPGFPDMLGFGRKVIPFEPDEIAAMLTYQIGALRAFLDLRGVMLNHVKPHAAMYGYIIANPSVGELAAETVHRLAPGCLIYWPMASTDNVYRNALAALGHPVVNEIYPDLRYNASGEPVIERRKLPTDIEFAKSQVRMWLTESKVQTEDGGLFSVDATSFCIHSDGPNAIDVARALKAEVASVGVEYRAALATA